MKRPLIRSGGLLVRSDEPREAVLCRIAPTPPQAGARPAAARVPSARHPGRNLPTLRAAKLPLRQRALARPEALSLHQPARRRPRRDYVPNGTHVLAAELIGNFRRLRGMLDEI